MTFPTSFLSVGSGLRIYYVEVFEDYPNEHDDGNKERSEGDGSDMVEGAADTSEDWSFWVSRLEIPDGCSRTDPE